jgi:hypothetical protein
MRADIHDGPEQRICSKQRPDTLMQDVSAGSTKTACTARPDHTLGSRASIWSRVEHVGVTPDAIVMSAAGALGSAGEGIEEIMGRKIAIVGAGAVGGYAGAHMVQAGMDVTFIDPWPERVEHMRKHGLRVTRATAIRVGQANGYQLEEICIYSQRRLHVWAKATNRQCVRVTSSVLQTESASSEQRPSMGQDMQKVVGPRSILEAALWCAKARKSASRAVRMRY